MKSSAFLVLWATCFGFTGAFQDGRSARVRRFPFEIEAFGRSYGFIPDAATLYETVADLVREEPDIQGDMANRYSQLSKASGSREVELTRLQPLQLEQVRSEFSQLQVRLTALASRLSKLDGDLGKKADVRPDARIVEDCLQSLNLCLKSPESAASKNDFFKKTENLDKTILSLICSLSGTCSMKGNILEAIRKLEECHFDNLYGRSKDLFKLLRTALQVHAMYVALRGFTLNETYTKDLNENSARIVQNLQRIEQDCQKEDEVATVMLRAMQDNRGEFSPFESTLAKIVHGSLASRYSDKYWFVLIHHASQPGPKHVSKFSDGFHQLLNVTLDTGRFKKDNQSEVYQLSAYSMSFSKNADLEIDKQVKKELKQALEDHKAVQFKFLSNRTAVTKKMSETFATLESNYGHLAKFVVVNNEGRSYDIDTYWKGVKPLCYKFLISVCYCALPDRSTELPASRLSVPGSIQKSNSDHNIPIVRRVVGYTTYWGTKPITEQQASYLTHAIFAYVELLPNGSFRVGGSRTIADAQAEKDQLMWNRRLDQLKTVKRFANGRLKILAGVTGWKNSMFFSQVASSSEQQDEIIRNLKAFLLKHEELDGLDVDWGYPRSNSGKSTNESNCHQFLQKLRTMLNDLAVILSRSDPYILTIATAATPSALNTGCDWDKVADLVDWINVKSFDYYGDWNSKEKDELYTGPVAPLNSAGTKQFSAARNLQYTVTEYFGKTLPRHKSKIVVGVPFYGRYWTNVDASDRVGDGRYRLKVGKDSSKSGIASWRRIHSNWMKADGFELKSFDSPNSGQYLWNSKDRTLLAFDGLVLLQTKLDYVIDNGLGGVAVWALDMDTDCNMLLKTFSFKETGEVEDTKTLLAAAAKIERPMGSSRVRLTQGDGLSFGYVEVTNHAGNTGYLAATNWNDKDATVVCRQLAFTDGVAVVPSRHYPLPKSKVNTLGIDNVNCTGEEHDILQCQHDVLQAANSNTSSLAAVVCHSTDSFLSKISLSGGNLVSYGHVIVTNGQSGQSGYICDNGWDDADATVVCTQLGFKSGRARRGSFFGTVANGTFFGLDNVHCYGKEHDILQCPHAGWKRHSCSRDQAAGVICQTVESPLSNIVLSGTNGLTYGQVLIVEKISGNISYVGQDDWDDTNAAVVCRQLGLGYGIATTVPTAEHGWRSNLLNEFKCTGSETDILQCIHEGGSTFTKAGVYCKPHSTFRNRIVLNGSPTCGNGYSSGNVMLAIGQKSYAQICRRKWTNRDADDVCRLLGFPGGEAMRCSSNKDFDSYFNFQRFECPENATSVFDCFVSYKDWPGETHVAVKCHERPGRPVTLKKIPHTRRYLFRNTGKTERLVHAAATGNLTRVRDLLSAGADVSQHDSTDSGLTALHKAAENGHLRIIEDLVWASANVNARDNLGWTPLHWASMAEQRDAAHLLIRSGADVDAKGEDGWTPLHHAAANGHALVVEALLLGGAAVDTRDNNGSTPLHWTAPYFFKANVGNLNETEINFNQNGNHALAAKTLVEHGADLHARDRHGWTPLHRAAMMHEKEGVARVLIKAGADINAQDNEGWTPLHWAAHHYRSKVACALIRAGANKEIRTFKTQKTPHDVAYLKLWDQFC